MDLLPRTLKDYWHILVFIGMVIVSWTTFSTRLNDLEKRVTILEGVASSLESVRIDIAVIKNDIGSIKNTLK
jgi:hypothetical protein